MLRRRHTELQPVVTSHDSAHGHARRASSTPGSAWTNTSTLPSPSVFAARAYFLEQSPPIGQNLNALQRRRSLIEAQEFPRRHSALPTPGGLISKIATSQVSNSQRNLEAAREIESGPDVKIEQAEDVSMTKIKHNNLVKINAVATAEQTDTGPVPSPESFQVPFQYTHDRLRDWGFAYVGNTATADAFINAVSLRRPSLQLLKEDITGDRPELAGMVAIRARVVPKDKERKPFIIQRKCDIEELRVSIPVTQRPIATHLRRSNRARRSSVQLSPVNLRRRTPDGLGENLSLLGRGAVPIHIEYALHFLPVLAALMLSGHIRKGDSIDLPVPHPEAWREMISYIYTGKGDITAGVKENILYLAGSDV